MADPRVRGNMSVREVLLRYPKAESVFDRHGLGGCGGPQGPQEPIAFFARVHKVDPEVLLRELNEFIDREDRDRRPRESQQVSSERQQDVYPLFAKTAIVIALTAGFSLGAGILLYPLLFGPLGAWWLPHVQVHGHAQVLGWVGLFIMGIAYHAVPRMKATALTRRPLVYASYAVVLASLALRLAGQPISQGLVRDVLVALSGTSEVAGAVLFLVVLWSTVATSLQPRDIYEKFLLSGAFWLCVASTANLALLVVTLSNGMAVVPYPAEDILLHIYFAGFIVSFVFGFSVRTLPTFLGLPALAPRGINVAFIALNAGIPIRLGGMALGQGIWGVVLTSLGTALEVAAFMGFVLALRVFRPSQAWLKESGMPRGHEKFLRGAYAWLMVAAAIDGVLTLLMLAGLGAPGFNEISGQRHALALGFITLMIFGMASRVIPVFSGTRLYAPGLLSAIFIVSNVGTALRVSFTLLPPLAVALASAMRGVSGVLNLAGLALFAYVIWRTLDRAAEESKAAVAPPARPAEAPVQVQVGVSPTTTPGPVTGDMLVAEVLDRWPDSLDVLVRSGFAPLADLHMRQAMASTVTMAQACRMRSVDMDTLLRDLNALALSREPTPKPTQAQGHVPAAGVREQITSALRDCFDPEVGINLVDLGMIESVGMEDGAVHVRLLLTSPGCPQTEEIEEQVRQRLLSVPGVQRVRVDFSDAPWSPDRVSEKARRELGIA